ncbi:putative aminopeptidase N [Toxoplasma gondii FOU]|uniref:Putative aminopeptidase N n=3 Tax=Toxoplasma gondii TaxID=5811 RepID=A0A086JLP0_TOXGO|nr:putative aminopeptidase N [Toxoplasma gondii FOU]PUA91346.1 putative aminopeptidase N [Toxoplasma gondii TgCATBr9]RQX74706.1 putative aminopeptidase N [Toxoplasma gondii CAST]
MRLLALPPSVQLQTSPAECDPLLPYGRERQRGGSARDESLQICKGHDGEICCAVDSLRHRRTRTDRRSRAVLQRREGRSVGSGQVVRGAGFVGCAERDGDGEGAAEARRLHREESEPAASVDFLVHEKSAVPQQGWCRLRAPGGLRPRSRSLQSADRCTRRGGFSAVEEIRRNPTEGNAQAAEENRERSWAVCRYTGNRPEGSRRRPRGSDCLGAETADRDTPLYTGKS